MKAGKKKHWLTFRSDVDPLELEQIGLFWDPLYYTTCILVYHVYTDKLNIIGKNNLIWRTSKQLCFYAVNL